VPIPHPVADGHTLVAAGLDTMTTITPARAESRAPIDTAAWLAAHAPADVLMTPDGWMTEANAPARRLFRLPPGRDVRGLNFGRFCRPPGRFSDAIQAIRAEGHLEGWDGDMVAFDQSPIHAVVNLVGEFADGFLIAIRAQLCDISTWRKTQERTLFGQRIDAIGRLAGGIAHDFNNVLMVISGHAERLSLGLPAESPMSHSVHAIQASAARAALLTEKLLSFGRRQVLQPQLADLTGVVRQVIVRLSAANERRVSPRVPELDRPGTVRIDPGRTETALHAIAAHALASMADDGTLEFGLDHVEFGAERTPAPSFVKPGCFVRLDIACAGLTLQADAIVRMFEPFFTEKGTVRSDGMALAAAFGLVKQSGGYLWFEGDCPGRATFTVLLPAVVEPLPLSGSGVAPSAR